MTWPAHHRSRGPGVRMLKQLGHLHPLQLTAESIVRGQHVPQGLTALRRPYQPLLQQPLGLVLAKAWRKCKLRP